MHVRSTQSGFTLIELLVSLTLFAVVVTITTGTFLVLVDANAKAQNIQTISNELTFALDSMTREIRTGNNYHCSAVGAGSIDNGIGNGNGPTGSPPGADVRRDCPNTSPGNLLQIIEGGNSLTGSGNSRIGYVYDANYYGSGHGAILRRIGDPSSGQEWFPLTSEKVRITNMRFVATGTQIETPVNTAGLQPTVTIFIQGSAGDLTLTDTDFAMQASVAQRLIDI